MSTPIPATDKQVAFIDTLLDQLATLGWVPTESMDFAPYSRRHASQLIDWLKGKLHEVRTEVAARPKIADTSNDPEIGYYMVDGEVYRVQANRAGNNTYAKVLRGTGWEYVGKSPFRSLVSEARLTYEQARVHGIETGHCLICGTQLDNIESAQYGIGPTCHKNLTGKTFAQARKAGELPPVVKPEIEEEAA
jgi:hypothetical protein